MSGNMREEFEAWASSYRDHNGLPHFTLRRPDGGYVDGTTEYCWRGWQASREALEIELPAKDKNRVFRDFFGRGMEFGYDRCREAIHAAGVKTK